jgi:TerC family integral membrane protein
MSPDTWIWLALGAVVVTMLAIDLVLFDRAGRASMGEAVAWSVGWFAVGLGVTGVVWWWSGPGAGGEYLAGYLIERSLSIDNVFIFAVIMSAFSVPQTERSRVLLWGIAGALVLRVIFIFAGIEMLERFAWTAYLLGILLIATGLRMARHSGGQEPDPQQNRLLRALTRRVPFSQAYHGRALTVREDGRRVATPLVAVLLVVATTDLLFAVDSIPAILAITTDSLVVVAANAFALLGLRALFTCLVGMMERFVYLALGLAAVLVFIGGKMIYGQLVGEVAVTVSLSVVVATMLAAVGASLLRTRGERATGDPA